MKWLFKLLLLALALSYSASAQTEEGATTPSENVKVFPNPATNVVNILGLQNSERAEIIVSDTYGNIVLKHLWAIKNKALNIPITSLGSGIYLITIRSQEQKVQTKFYKR